MSSIEELQHMEIPLKQILLATNKFAKENLIALGGFGKVYYGTSETYGTIAVKRLVRDNIGGQGSREFLTEITLLSAYKHENIVSLLGFCDEGGEKILVYKHESKGNLQTYLHSKDLTWIQRLGICLDAARGLKYLHDDVGAQHRIIHRDVKSSNILLGDDWKAKVSDFGLSKVGPANVEYTFLISVACGTIGYIDPEYVKDGILTQKSDVYSFGVVLFEVLCGRPARVVKPGDKHQLLVDLVKNHWKEGTLKNIIVSGLQNPLVSASFNKFTSIAFQCLNKKREKRPLMSVVVKELEEALAYQQASSQSRADDNLTYSQMAIEQPRSTASISQFDPTSSSQPWQHDVFISFRGEDTRSTFVGRLYTTLSQRGIRTYKDDETILSIVPAVTKAIRESQIAIIVFSKNYAGSSRCLDELAYIMKYRDDRGLIVMPVYYDVAPSEVRKQKGEFGNAFKKPEHENITKVEIWRKALVDVSNISGWDIANGDSRFFLEIVDTILDRLDLVIKRDEDLVGMEARVVILESMLKIKSDGVVMVGIWGLGGGGKTTLASSVYYKISNKFDSCCFLDNIREEVVYNGLVKMQEKLLLIALNKKTVRVMNVDDGKRMIKSSLCHKKVLIVLDDVGSPDQLEALAGSLDWFGEGSLIIITTRDMHVLKTHHVDVIQNTYLLHDGEAMKLFRYHAFKDYRDIEDYEMLSKAVVAYCGGLPLAIKVLGSFLYSKDMNEWMSTLERLKDIPHPEIMEKLKISYDGLRPVEKELFLDIACFFNGEQNEEAMKILDACGFNSTIGVNVLLEKALITVSSDGKLFQMHGLVQQMGHSIVRGEDPYNPQMHSRVWWKEDILKLCDSDATKEDLNIEALTYDSFAGDLPRRLPQVVANMKKLRWISWSGHPESLVPNDFQPMDLRCLMLKFSLQKRLWHGCKHLPNMILLDLRGSTNLIETPDIGGLRSLERMILRDCIDLVEIHPSIGNHQSLKFLDMTNCQSLKSFPPIIQMEKLETLILSHCSRLGKFPEIQMKMDNLVQIVLNNSGIEDIPSSIVQYCTNLVSLDLRGCIHLKSIQGDFSLLQRLEGLLLEGCIRLENHQIMSGPVKASG